MVITMNVNKTNKYGVERILLGARRLRKNIWNYRRRSGSSGTTDSAVTKLCVDFCSEKAVREAACGATGNWPASRRALAWGRWFIRRWTSTPSGYRITRGEKLVVGFRVPNGLSGRKRKTAAAQRIVRLAGWLVSWLLSRTNDGFWIDARRHRPRCVEFELFSDDLLLFRKFD